MQRPGNAQKCQCVGIGSQTSHVVSASVLDLKMCSESIGGRKLPAAWHSKYYVFADTDSAPAEFSILTTYHFHLFLVKNGKNRKCGFMFFVFCIMSSVSDREMCGWNGLRRNFWVRDTGWNHYADAGSNVPWFLSSKRWNGPLRILGDRVVRLISEIEPHQPGNIWTQTPSAVSGSIFDPKMCSESIRGRYFAVWHST